MGYIGEDIYILSLFSFSFLYMRKIKALLCFGGHFSQRID